MALRTGGLSKSFSSTVLRQSQPLFLWPTQPSIHALARFALPSASRRSLSTVPPFSLSRVFPQTRPLGSDSMIQKRWSTMGSSHNLLAHMEQTANNNPNSATAQNAFYAALLRANMPAIIVERYQNGRFASNAACQATYVKALERLGGAGAETGAATGGAGFAASGAGQESQLSNETLQSVAQAVASKTRGGNASIATNAQGAMGQGSRKAPLYVVTDETLGQTIFKWVKMILYFGLIAYICLIGVHLMVDATGVLRRATGTGAIEAKQQKARFADVHGCDEAKEELQELVEFLKDPKQFATLGGKLPKGILLTGPPGTGKTLLARAVAGEAGVPFFYMSGSEFDEIYVGVGAKRIRELFTQARSKAPAIIFIDELDAVGGKRQEKEASYHKQTLNQLLTELDGFEQDSGVIIIGATNFPKALDKALTRPGRFDRNVVVSLPDVRGRMKILEFYMQKVKAASEIDITVIARKTTGFSGADLENLVNQAAVRASKNRQPALTLRDLDWAIDKIMMGTERRSAVIQEKDKLMTAYHEGGHALVGMFTPGASQVYKATIMPRGSALGVTHFLPEMDQVSQSKAQLRASIDVSMGGKIAEELVYGLDNTTSGASSDITNATRVAYDMVTAYGFSEKLGDVNYNHDAVSTETRHVIEGEVRRMIDESRTRTTALLQEKRKELDLLAKALVKYETLDLEEIRAVLRGEEIPYKMEADPKAPIKLPGQNGPEELAIPPPISLPDLPVPPHIGGKNSNRDRDEDDGRSNNGDRRGGERG